MQQTKTPKVNEVNEFLEIASDFEDPLEVIRESLSNSYDAAASNVQIEIHQRDAGSEIVIEDDGHGMGPADLESFFDLGNSTKIGPEDDSIGYKGHGTKIFYKSDNIVVTTTHNGTTYQATMTEPWKKLNNRVMPTYEVTESDTPEKSAGTRIEVTGFRSGQGFSPKSLTYDKIEHYLNWKTLAGSTAHFFDDDARELNIIVELGDEIDDSKPRIGVTNQFEFPPEQLDPSDSEFAAASMCKHYGPEELTATTDDGEEVTIQVVGMVGGKEARDELPTFGRHSTQFGIWLAKDHIKVERLNEAISHDNEFIHFMFVANCQRLELSANREQIRNKSSSVYQAIEEKLGYHISKITSDPWFKQYLEERRIAQVNRRAETQAQSVEQRRESITNRDRFEATNQTEVLLGLQQASRQDNGVNITVEDFQVDSDVNAVLNQTGTLLAASVHVHLIDHFEEEKPLQHISTIVCWGLGDPDALRQLERSGYQNGEMSFNLAENELTYIKNGEQFTIEILEVQRLLD